MRAAHTHTILKQTWRKEESCFVPSLQWIFMAQCISKHNDNVYFNLHITIVCVKHWIKECEVSEPVYSKQGWWSMLYQQQMDRNPSWEISSCHSSILLPPSKTPGCGPVHWRVAALPKASFMGNWRPAGHKVPQHPERPWQEGPRQIYLLLCLKISSICFPHTLINWPLVRALQVLLLATKILT